MAGYAAFAATHRERLVRSLVAETGLPRATARVVADEVLACAWERGVTSRDGAAYGWLRVAARHRAASPSCAWAEAADAAVSQAPSAVAALASLPADDRALLRLRYAEGLLPSAIAERLDTTVPDVLARLDAAWVAATAGLSSVRRRPFGDYARPVAAALVGAVAVLSVLVPSAHPRSSVPPGALGLPGYSGLPWTSDPVEPVSDVSLLPPAAGWGTGLSAGPSGQGGLSGRLGGDTDDPPPCRLPGNCLGRAVDTEEIHVPLPKQVAEAAGTPEVVVKQGYVPVSVCRTVPSPPAEVASCVPADT